MKIPNIGGLVQVGKTLIIANRPELLFGASVTATIGAVVLAARGGYNARGIVDAAEAVPGTQPLTTQQKANLTWHCYAPAAVTTLTAIGSTTGLHLVHVKEKKQLAQAAMIAIDQVKKDADLYAQHIKEAVEENITLTDEDREKIDETLMEKNADTNGGKAIVHDSDGVVEEMYLVRDAYTGRDIWSNKTRIEDAVVEINAAIGRNGDCELDYFYGQAGFNDIPHGMDVGWNVPIKLTWSSDVRDDGRPVRSFTFQPRPETGFDKAARAQ